MRASFHDSTPCGPALSWLFQLSSWLAVSQWCNGLCAAERRFIQSHAHTGEKRVGTSRCDDSRRPLWMHKVTTWHDIIQRGLTEHVCIYRNKLYHTDNIFFKKKKLKLKLNCYYYFFNLIFSLRINWTFFSYVCLFVKYLEMTGRPFGSWQLSWILGKQNCGCIQPSGQNEKKHWCQWSQYLISPAVGAVLQSSWRKTASSDHWRSTGPQQLLLTAPRASSTASWPSPGGRAAPTFLSLLQRTALSTPPSSRTRLQTPDLQQVAPLSLVSYRFPYKLDYLLTSDRNKLNWRQNNVMKSRFDLQITTITSKLLTASQVPCPFWVPEITSKWSHVFNEVTSESLRLCSSHCGHERITKVKFKSLMSSWSCCGLLKPKGHFWVSRSTRITGRLSDTDQFKPQKVEFSRSVQGPRRSCASSSGEAGVQSAGLRRIHPSVNFRVLMITATTCENNMSDFWSSGLRSCASAAEWTSTAHHTGVTLMLNRKEFLSTANWTQSCSLTGVYCTSKTKTTKSPQTISVFKHLFIKILFCADSHVNVQNNLNKRTNTCWLHSFPVNKHFIWT